MLKNDTDYSKQCVVAILVDRHSNGEHTDKYLYQRPQFLDDALLTSEAHGIFKDMRDNKGIVKPEGTLVAIGVARNKKQFEQMGLGEGDKFVKLNRTHGD